jgi:phage protein D
MPWTVDWRVRVDGTDVSARMRPYLTDIEVEDRDGMTSDTCSLTIDDADGAVRLPREGARVSVDLQGGEVFRGVVDSVRSNGGRGQGRLLKIGAKGFDSRGKAKEPLNFHRDDATLREFLGEAARQAGLSGIVVDPTLADIIRDYWSAEAESFIHLGQKLAREFFGTFKIRDDIAVLTKRGGANSLAAVHGSWGVNLISWDIAPITGRRMFTKSQVVWFDRKNAKFETEEVSFDLPRDLPDAVNLVRSRAHDRDQAQGIGEARKREAEREGGEGTVEIDLAVDAKAEGIFVLSGTRAGVDGAYRIVSVKHRASRASGSTTQLELKQPHGGAGADTRSGNGSAGQPGNVATAAAGNSPGGGAAGGTGVTLPPRGGGLTDAN